MSDRIKKNIMHNKQPSTENKNQKKSFDIINDILETLRFRSTIFFHSDLAAPWGVSFPHVGVPRFHISLSGQFFVGTEEQQTVKVKQNEIALMPTGGCHWIADEEGRNLLPSDEVGETCKLAHPMFKQGTITNRIMCGIVNYDQHMGHPIFDSLSHILHFANFTSDDATWSLVTLIDQEMQATDTCNNPIVDRLTEALFIKLIHQHLADKEQGVGFIGALHDRRVHQALTLIHQHPHMNWTLDKLSEHIGMSRSTLTRYFQKNVGSAPMAYIANWRMTKAYNLIKYSDTCLENIAESVGFGSARTLNKAFQRHYGRTPNELREEAQAALEDH